MTAVQARPHGLDVLVVDDHRAFADAISLAIDVQDDLSCCGTVGTAEEALDVVATSCPSVVLLDLALPGMSGIAAIGPLRQVCPDIRVVVLTASTSASDVASAMEAGADCFLPKEQPFAEVLEALRGDDSVMLDPATVTRVLSVAQHGDGLSTEVVPELTDRELEILLLLADAHSVKSIARLLSISVHTCRGHVRSVLAKFDAHSQLEAVVRAVRMGLIPQLRATHG